MNITIDLGSGIGSGGSGGTGADGITPHIGTNGNWFIGTTDTGISAQGPKGTDGSDGVGIKSIIRTSGDGSVGTTDTYTIALTDGNTATFTVYNGKNGEDGTDGNDGQNGVGIQSISKTSGDGSPGVTDTYTIMLTDGSTSEFTVYNGSDGTGDNGVSIPISADEPESSDFWIDDDDDESGTLVYSFNGRIGAVVPAGGDYTHDMIGAAPDIHASQHASDGDDPITPADIGAVANDLAFDISGQDLITAVGGKSGFYRGQNVTNAPNGSAGWFYYWVSAGGSNTVVIAAEMSGNGNVYKAWFGNSGVSVTWYKLASAKSSLEVSTLDVTGNPDSENYVRVFDYRTTARFRNMLDNSNYAEIIVPQSGNDLKFEEMVEGAYTSRTILHTGNKPSGSYTGNGVDRTIPVGGIGNVLVAHGNGNCFVVTGSGAFGKNGNGELIAFAFEDCHFYEGDFFLSAAASASINHNGYGYEYQVL